MVEEEGGYLSGTITLEGTDIKSLPKEKLRRRVGMVFQQPIAFPHSIEKNLSYVLKYHGVRNKKEIAEKITESLQKAKLYDEVKDQLKKSALKLSGGQKQRLAIARSLCAGPEILLLDEPCSALDMKNTIAIEETLLELKDQYTFVIVTHNLAQAKRIADQVIFMDQGEVLEVTEKEKFFENPASDFCQSDFYFSISLSSSLTIPGFAFPFIAFMICPTSAPSAFSFPPLKSSTAFGFFAITSSASVRSAPSSLTVFSP